MAFGGPERVQQALGGREGGGGLNRLTLLLGKNGMLLGFVQATGMGKNEDPICWVKFQRDMDRL